MSFNAISHVIVTILWLGCQSHVKNLSHFIASHDTAPTTYFRRIRSWFIIITQFTLNFSLMWFLRYLWFSGRYVSFNSVIEEHFFTTSVRKYITYTCVLLCKPLECHLRIRNTIRKCTLAYKLFVFEPIWYILWFRGKYVSFDNIIAQHDLQQPAEST